MQFVTPSQHQFEIPDEWWHFAEMDEWDRKGGRFYPPPLEAEFDLIPTAEIEPPSRAAGLPPFKKFMLVPILFAIRSPECALPPIKLIGPNQGAEFSYRVQNGFHRYYASAAVGFPLVPAVIIPPDQVGETFAE